MKIGLISDVHGNRPTFEAVLGDMPAVDTVVCAGVVGYNPWPVECVDRVISRVGEETLALSVEDVDSYTCS